MWLFLRADALGLPPASRVRCGRVRADAPGAFFAFLTTLTAARVKYENTGFLHKENICEEFTDISFCLTDGCIGDDSNDAVTEWLNFGKIERTLVFPRWNNSRRILLRK